MVGIVLLPVRIHLQLGIDRRLASPLGLEVRVWGLRILKIPGPRTRRSSWLGRRLSAWLDDFFSSKPSPLPSSKPVRKRKPIQISFVFWALRRGLNLLCRLTRRLEVGCGGIDPALLGALCGLAAIGQGVLGGRKLGWVPDFSPGPIRLRVGWDLSFSIYSLVRWTGETFSDRNRQHRKLSGFVTSKP